MIAINSFYLNNAGLRNFILYDNMARNLFRRIFCLIYVAIYKDSLEDISGSV